MVTENVFPPLSNSGFMCLKLVTLHIVFWIFFFFTTILESANSQGYGCDLWFLTGLLGILLYILGAKWDAAKSNVHAAKSQVD